MCTNQWCQENRSVSGTSFFGEVATVKRNARLGQTFRGELTSHDRYPQKYSSLMPGLRSCLHEYKAEQVLQDIEATMII